VWPENYSANSAQKVWAANFAAHHPNVAVLDLSSFKCGHDAPTYGMIDSVLQTSKTPSAALHDLDANKPGGSILIRVKTYAHSLRLQQERLEELASSKRQLARAIDEKRLALLKLKESQLLGLGQHDPAIQHQIAALKDKMRSYRAPDAAPVAIRPTAGLVQLQRKQADGTLIPVALLPASAVPIGQPVDLSGGCS
jgi:hypothetical protein